MEPEARGVPASALGTLGAITLPPPWWPICTVGVGQVPSRWSRTDACPQPGGVCELRLLLLHSLFSNILQLHFEAKLCFFAFA